MINVSSGQLVKLDFELVDDYKDSELEYKDYKYRDVIVTLEKPSNKIELQIKNEFLEVKGVKNGLQLEKFLELLYDKSE